MKENVVIVGGGVAGMEAAANLLQLGYEVSLVEKSDRLGGHVAEWYKLFPDMLSADDIVENLKEKIATADVFLNTSVEAVEYLKSTYHLQLSNGQTLQAKALLLASGFSLFDAGKKEEYGYGVHDHVVTNRDLEAWLKGTPNWHIPKVPQTIGFVHCVGSRDLKACNSQCSKVCCTTAVKQAIEIKERFADAEVYCFYMDLRLFGKKYEDFYIYAQRDFGVHFIRGRVSEVSETLDGRLQVKAEDTLVGKPLKVQLDLLVLMSGMVHNDAILPLAWQLQVNIDKDGFLKSDDNVTHIVESSRKGIFFAGACTGAKTVPETMAEARAAALGIHLYLQRL